MPALKISTPEREGVLQVSKSRKIMGLIDLSEMQNLLSELGDFLIYDVSRPVDLESAEIDRSIFLRAYGAYVLALKQGEIPEEAALRPYFSSIWTRKSDGVYAQTLSNGKFLIKPTMPPIQLQRHHFVFSGAFHSGGR